jgi:cyclopropane fatty-acyl-phospholipid synthase-like methyltransferase
MPQQSEPPSRPHHDALRSYYDINTPAFSRFGRGASAGAIRRTVWAPQVQSERDAFHYADALILGEVERARPEPHVLDLGCGLCASLIYLARRAPIRGVGVTISAVQASESARRLHTAGVTDRVTCLHGDYLAGGLPLTAADVAFSIEAFVHAPSAERYFQAVASLVAPGGTLIVIDDFVTERARSSASAADARVLATFRDGWLAPTQVTEHEAGIAARAAGFEPLESRSLTPFLELQRPRDRLLRVISPLLAYLPLPDLRRRSLIGGDALQRGLRSGLIDYRYMSWRRRG